MFIVLVATYFGIGFLTSFCVMLIAYKQKWEDMDRQPLSIVAIPFWPALGPIIMVHQLYKAMDRRARQLA